MFGLSESRAQGCRRRAFGDVYLWTAAIFGTALIALNAWLFLRPTAAHAWAVFKFSSPYPAIVFLFMVLGPYLPQ